METFNPNKMNREEFFEQIKPYVEKYIDGFYDEKFEGANIRQIITIAEQYAESKVSELKSENEKLKGYLKANSLLLTQREKMFVSPHDGTITQYDGQSVYQEVKAGHLYCPNVVEGGKIEIIEINLKHSLLIRIL